jgi:hypothetical protein
VTATDLIIRTGQELPPGWHISIGVTGSFWCVYLIYLPRPRTMIFHPGDGDTVERLITAAIRHARRTEGMEE